MITHWMKIALLGTAVGLSQAAFADPKPKGAQNAPAQLVANSLAGKTNNWKDCKGGIYYGANWQAQAYCNRESPAIGIGTWSVNSKGRLCHKLTWYWPEGDGVGSKNEPVTKRDCHDHVLAPDGALWWSWGGDKEWWKFATNRNITKGFKYKGKINRLRRKLGV